MTDRTVTDRRASELDELAERVSDVLNGIAPKLPIKPEDVDVRMIAELCWAIGAVPSISLAPRPFPKNHRHSHSNDASRYI